MLFFAAVAAFCAAKLEVNIEGSDGPWAKNLPTYRFKNKLNTFLMGKNSLMTGYHVWLNTSFLVIPHFLFFAGVPWSLSLELRIIGIFLIGAALEDLFYFVINPAYGLGKFNSKDAYWHRWVGPLPMLYWVYFSLAFILLYLSYLV